MQQGFCPNEQVARLIQDSLRATQGANTIKGKPHTQGGWHSVHTSAPRVLQIFQVISNQGISPGNNQGSLCRGPSSIGSSHCKILVISPDSSLGCPAYCISLLEFNFLKMKQTGGSPLTPLNILPLCFQENPQFTFSSLRAGETSSKNRPSRSPRQVPIC